jgi:Ca2+:H+ antiporter
MILRVLLLFIPVSILLAVTTSGLDTYVFIASVLAIVPIAELVRKSTEHIAHQAGSAIGGLLNVTFGNVAELLIGLFVIAAGGADVVKGQIAGSIVGNSLLGLGLAIVVGGATREKQTFRRDRAGLLSSLLILSVCGLILPSVFDYSERAGHHNPHLGSTEQFLSLGVAVILILVYAANLVYTFVTHRNVFVTAEEETPPNAWPLSRSILALFGGTALIAVEAELVSRSLDVTARNLHLSSLFLGITVLAIVGNASEYLSAVYFAKQNRMGLVLSITVGSSIQMALLVAPLLVIASYMMGKPMDLVFSTPLELIAITAVAFGVNSIAQDGESNWFEGVLLLGIYAILAIAFYFVTPS